MVSDNKIKIDKLMKKKPLIRRASKDFNNALSLDKRNEMMPIKRIEKRKSLEKKELYINKDQMEHDSDDDSSGESSSSSASESDKK